MPGWNDCSIYEDDCRKGKCVHRSVKAVTVPQRIMDIVTDNGIPFRVVYENRVYRSGAIAEKPTVAFYDARYDFDAHGQFVSDYDRESLLERRRGYGMDLQGDVPNWYIDAGSMDLVLRWLTHLVTGEER